VAEYEVSVRSWFAAAHQLRLADGTLEPLHGHNWNVTVTYAGPSLAPAGWLIDFTLVQARLNELLRTLHERTLNDLPAFRERSPTAEAVAVFIAQRMSCDLPVGVRLKCVEVEEALGCYARYLPTVTVDR
jgi:6-pyruvoyltetrahydropterin/6-carboxytetrahydropterin synthase